MCQFSSKSRSKSVSEVRKTRFLTVNRVSCSSALCPKLLIISHVTPWVYFRLNQSVNLSNTVSEVQKNPFFDGSSGFLQLGSVLETSNIAHVTRRVHAFLGKKEFFKSFENFFLFGYTNIHTKSDQHKYCYRLYKTRKRKNNRKWIIFIAFSTCLYYESL